MIRKALAVTLGILTGIAIGLFIISQNAQVNAENQLKQIDSFIDEHSDFKVYEEEPETVSLSYSEWEAQQEQESESSYIEPETEFDYSEMDVWQLGLILYGINEWDTTRTLKLITYEGYGYSPLSYYVACCCWVRATEGYWGYDNLYSAFGEADQSNYGEWLDYIEIEDYAYEYLRMCYLNPTYVKYCNGMTEPWDYIYYEEGIYVWN